MRRKPIRLGVVVSHPIQYFVPLYRRLTKRNDIELKVFYTWHAATGSQRDPGFQQEIKWDIPLIDGYEFELVRNVARNPGTHHFFGLRNPELVDRVVSWRPDAVQITGYAFAAHLNAIRQLSRRGIPVLFRGDSHLLDEQQRGVRWKLKHLILSRIYRDVRGCLYVGKHNYDYYRAFGVPESRLFYCPHSIDVDRFAEPNDELEARASAWKRELAIPETVRVMLFAGKFQSEKRPLQLMRAILNMDRESVILVLVGGGELEQGVRELAAVAPDRFRILPFQNQSLMPVVYRLGDLFVLPSVSETWGLAVNEALASGRRVLLSNRVGCASDVVTSREIGDIFTTFDRSDFGLRLRALFDAAPNRQNILSVARRFTLPATEEALCEALRQALDYPM
jgi:glycosyltransferase involved in cell wall biosynthesis